MPEVAGISLANARLMLRNAGFDPERVAVRYQEAYRPADEVTGQVPSPGTLVAVDEPVELVVSRRSLLHALPQVFQKADRDGGHFLREFLWIFDHLSADLQRKLDRVNLYFDPREARPNSSTGWRAGWPSPSTRTGPRAQAQAHPQGHRDLRVAGHRPRAQAVPVDLHGRRAARLREQVSLQGLPHRLRSASALDSIVLPQVNLSHCFIVEVPARYTDITNENILKVHDIIRMEKPVHSMYVLTFAAAPKSDQLQASSSAWGAWAAAGVIGRERSGCPPRFRSETDGSWPTLQAHQLLQGLPDHRAGLERRRALSRREAQAAQPRVPRPGRRARLRRRSAGVEPRARRPLHRGRRRLRHRRAGQRHPAAREADQDHQPRRLQAAATIYIVLRYAEDFDDFIAYKENLDYQGHRRIEESAKVEFSIVEPDIEHEVELARVFLEKGAKRVSDARDPRTPVANEIDLRFVRWAGVCGTKLPRG
jgi:hypothetical protein